MKRIVLYIGLLFTISPAFAQFEYNFLGKGARAAGMAYAFSAIADDATAMSWNPAGTVQVKKPEIALVNSLTSIKLDSRLDEFNYHPTYMVDYLGLVYPFKLKMKDLVLGVSFQNKMNYKYNFESLASELGHYEGENSLAVNAITLTGAYSINRFLAAGISYSHWFSLGNKEHTNDEYNTHIDTSIIYDIHKRFSYYGNNFTAGLFLDLAPLHFPLRFAVKYEDRFTLKNDYDNTSQIDYDYTNSEDQQWTYLYKGTDKYYIPRIITTGLSYRFGDYLTVAYDMEIRLYSGKYYGWNYRYIENYTTNNNMIQLKDTVFTGVISYDKFSSKLNQHRIGIEYILHPKSALIPIRAGWKNNPTSLFDYSDKVNPKQVYAHSLNFGAGFITKRFSLDFAFENYNYELTDYSGNHVEKTYKFFLLSAIIYLK